MRTNRSSRFVSRNRQYSALDAEPVDLQSNALGGKNFVSHTLRREQLVPDVNECRYETARGSPGTCAIHCTTLCADAFVSPDRIKLNFQRENSITYRTRVDSVYAYALKMP